MICIAIFTMMRRKSGTMLIGCHKKCTQGPSTSVKLIHIAELEAMTTNTNSLTTMTISRILMSLRWNGNPITHILIMTLSIALGTMMITGKSTQRTKSQRSHQKQNQILHQLLNRLQLPHQPLQKLSMPLKRLFLTTKTISSSLSTIHDLSTTLYLLTMSIPFTKLYILQYITLATITTTIIISMVTTLLITFGTEMNT